MPSIDILAFVVGAALIVIGIFGGGMEVKEIKVPKIAGLARVAAFGVGLLFVVVGIGYDREHGNPDHVAADDRAGKARVSPAATPERVSPAPTPERVSAAPAPERVSPAPAPEPVVDAPPRRADIERAELRGQVIQMLSGRWRIRWQMGTVLHDAVLVMDGREGAMRVFLRDNQTQDGYAVDQRMALEFGEDGVYLLGSNPVIAETNRPDPNYAADGFRIRSVGDRLEIMLCDTQKRCGKVHFERG